jgi:hypothetical protein
MAQPIQPISHLDPAASKRGFYRLQLSAWTNFDPSNAELMDIAQAIEQGRGFLSVIEVTSVVDEVAKIDDPEIRQRFETVMAAEKLLENVGELPEPIRAKLYAALVRERQDEQRLAG